jgi:ribosomal protein S18 acetylase RimI-like enzyme
VKKSHIPDSVHDDLENKSEAVERALRGEVILFGALHESCVQIIREASPESVIPSPVPGIDLGYMKYLFRPSTLPAPRELPKGLRWGSVRPQDFSRVRSRTSIPRQDATLALLPSLAIFREGEVDGAPIAWGFRGPDSSLTSLHTEPEYRGQGLAKMLVGKLYRDGSYSSLDACIQLEETKDIRDEYFHADVAIDNQSSRAVCRGLGGTEGWIVHWIRLNTMKD